jgi:hypothetical protein
MSKITCRVMIMSSEMNALNDIQEKCKKIKIIAFHRKFPILGKVFT